MTRDNGGVRSDLHRFLLDAGASEDDIERARAEGWLPLLALDRLVTPGRPTHDARRDRRARGHRRGTAPPAVARGRLPRRARGPRRVHRRRRRRGAPARSKERSRAAIRLRDGAPARPRDQRRRWHGSPRSSPSPTATRSATSARQGIDDETVACVESSTTSTATSSPRCSCTPRSLQLRAAVWRRLEPRRGARPRGGDRLRRSRRATRRSAPSSTPTTSPRSSGDGRRSRTTPSPRHGGRVVKTIGDEVMFVGLSAQVAGIAIALRDAAADAGAAAGARRDRGGHGRRARRRLLRTGREPREPPHRDRAAAARSTRPAALHDELAADASFDVVASLGTRAICAASARSRCFACSSANGLSV